MESNTCTTVLAKSEELRNTESLYYADEKLYTSQENKVYQYDLKN